MSKNVIHLDIETLNFFQDPAIKALPRAQQLEAIRFGVAVTLDSEWKVWTPDDIHALWARIDQADAVVGWNILDFDLPILRSASARAGRNPQPMPAFDMFAEIRAQTGRWYKLEVVSQANLSRGKLADGQAAAEWLRSGDAALVERAIAYCKADVQLVIDLYDLAQRQPLHLPGLDREGQGEALDLDLRQEDGWFRLIQTGV